VRRTHSRHSGMRRRRRPGIHPTAERVAKWIPGSRYARPGMTGARGETWMAGTSPAMTEEAAYTCGATKLSTFTPSRCSMISAIIWR
jgi:hypothetical protein